MSNPLVIGANVKADGTLINPYGCKSDSLLIEKPRPGVYDIFFQDLFTKPPSVVVTVKADNPVPSPRWVVHTKDVVSYRASVHFYENGEHKDTDFSLVVIGLKAKL